MTMGIGECCVAANVSSWPVCDLPECPREVGYQGRSGLVLLTRSLAGVDPNPTLPAVNCCSAKGLFVLDFGCPGQCKNRRMGDDAIRTIAASRIVA